MFHSLHGLKNSISWPASSIWVFIAQLGEYCSANAEATGSNPVEAPKNFFSGYFSQLLKLRFTAMVTYSFHNHSFIGLQAGERKASPRLPIRGQRTNVNRSQHVIRRRSRVSGCRSGKKSGPLLARGGIYNGTGNATGVILRY